LELRDVVDAREGIIARDIVNALFNGLAIFAVKVELDDQNPKVASAVCSF